MKKYRKIEVLVRFQKLLVFYILMIRSYQCCHEEMKDTPTKELLITLVWEAEQAVSSPGFE